MVAWSEGNLGRMGRDTYSVQLARYSIIVRLFRNSMARISGLQFPDHPFNYQGLWTNAHIVLPKPHHVCITSRTG